MAKNGVNRENLHPFATKYEYIGGPIKAEGIFEGQQTSPWIKVSRPSDWYRGPWQVDRTQHEAYRRQPRPLSIVGRGEGYRVSPAVSVSGCSACGMGADGDKPSSTLLLLTVAAIGIVAYQWLKD